jgi:hypothetical protein
MKACDTNLAMVTSNGVCAPARPAGSIETGRPDAGGTALGLADWLGLAAAPTFAVMALLTSISGGGPADVLCAAARNASPLGGMAVMYLLMSAFHLTPWLKLLSARRNGAV